MLLGLLQPRSPWRAMSKPTVGLVVRKRRSAACPNPLRQSAKRRWPPWPSSANQEGGRPCGRPKHFCYLLLTLGASAAHASSYLALAIAVAGWNVLGQVSLVDLGSPATARGAGMLAALPGDAAQGTARQR
jgi:hypothetical protein